VMRPFIGESFFQSIFHTVVAITVPEDPTNYFSALFPRAKRSLSELLMREYKMAQEVNVVIRTNERVRHTLSLMLDYIRRVPAPGWHVAHTNGGFLMAEPYDPGWHGAYANGGFLMAEPYDPPNFVRPAYVFMGQENVMMVQNFPVWDEPPFLPPFADLQPRVADARSEKAKKRAARRAARYRYPKQQRRK